MRRESILLARPRPWPQKVTPERTDFLQDRVHGKVLQDCVNGLERILLTTKRDVSLQDRVNGNDKIILTPRSACFLQDRVNGNPSKRYAPRKHTFCRTASMTMKGYSYAEDSILFAGPRQWQPAEEYAPREHSFCRTRSMTKTNVRRREHTFCRTASLATKR